jgi:hypothetical protein
MISQLSQFCNFFTRQEKSLEPFCCAAVTTKHREQTSLRHCKCLIYGLIPVKLAVAELIFARLRLQA